MDDILRVIIDLINTSRGHQAWLEDDTEGSGLGGYGTIYTTGPAVGAGRMVLDGTDLRIGELVFDLNNPDSISQIENLFSCDEAKDPQFCPITAISQLMDHPPQ